MSRCIKSRPSYKPVVHIGWGWEEAKTERNFTPALIQRINAPTLQLDAATTTLDFRLASPVRLTVSLLVSLSFSPSRYFSHFLIVFPCSTYSSLFLHVSLCFLLFPTVYFCFALVPLCFALFRACSPCFVQFCCGSPSVSFYFPLPCVSLFLPVPFSLFLLGSCWFSQVLPCSLCFTVLRSVPLDSMPFLSLSLSLWFTSFLFLFLESGEGGDGRAGVPNGEFTIWHGEERVTIQRATIWSRREGAGGGYRAGGHSAPDEREEGGGGPDLWSLWFNQVFAY